MNGILKAIRFGLYGIRNNDNLSSLENNFRTKTSFSRPDPNLDLCYVTGINIFSLLGHFSKNYAEIYLR